MGASKGTSHVETVRLRTQPWGAGASRRSGWVWLGVRESKGLAGVPGGPWVRSGRARDGRGGQEGLAAVRAGGLRAGLAP